MDTSCIWNAKILTKSVTKTVLGQTLQHYYKRYNSVTFTFSGKFVYPLNTLFHLKSFKRFTFPFIASITLSGK